VLVRGPENSAGRQTLTLRSTQFFIERGSTIVVTR
jgi:hypothetical protein